MRLYRLIETSQNYSLNNDVLYMTEKEADYRNAIFKAQKGNFFKWVPIEQTVNMYQMFRKTRN